MALENNQPGMFQQLLQSHRPPLNCCIYPFAGDVTQCYLRKHLQLVIIHSRRTLTLNSFFFRRTRVGVGYSPSRRSEHLLEWTEVNLISGGELKRVYQQICGENGLDQRRVGRLDGCT